MTSSELVQLLNAEGILADQTMVADVEYALPDLGWLANDFAPALGKFFEQLKVNKWLEEQFDCDNFAEGAKFFAGLCHTRWAKESGKEKTGLAFGEYWYRQESSGGGHAINCAAVKLRGSPKIVFFEPQHCLVFGRDPIVTLTQGEKLQCLGYKF